MAPGVRPRVLVIEDDPSVRVSVCDMLESLGYETDDAEGGGQGIALLERQRYDLVITDIRMPSMSGWDVCGERGSPTTADDADHHDLRFR